MKMRFLHKCSLFILTCLLFLPLNLKAEDLMGRIKGDLDSGNNIVITSYVGLWYANQHNPARNIYWGNQFGHGDFFKNPKDIHERLPFISIYDYKIEYEFISPLISSQNSRKSIRDSLQTSSGDETNDDPILIRVMSSPYSRRGNPKSGQKPGKIIVIYLVYENMNKAVIDMGLHLKTGELPSKINSTPVLKEKLSDLLNSSYIIGYWGHNVYYGGVDIGDGLEKVENIHPENPKGVFMYGCMSAHWFPQKFLAKGIEPITFTRTNMCPDASSASALYDGIARGLSKIEINRNTAKAYQIIQNTFTTQCPNTPYDLFISNEYTIMRLSEPIENH
jgi:hypothetical protein